MDVAPFWNKLDCRPKGSENLLKWSIFCLENGRERILLPVTYFPRNLSIPFYFTSIGYNKDLTKYYPKSSIDRT